MKLVSALTETDREALTRLHSDGPTHRQRQRAKAVLLSAKGYTLEQIADVLDTSRFAVSGWLDRWQKHGLNGLADAPKSGRRRWKDSRRVLDGILWVLHTGAPWGDLPKASIRLIRAAIAGSAAGW